MSQTTGAIASSNFKVEVSDNGTSWVDISGVASTVSVDGGDVKVGNQHTAEGAEALVVSGNKVDPRTVTVKSVYTEVDGEAFDTVWERYSGADKTIYLRWSPKGGAIGDVRFTCAVGGDAAAVPIVSCTLPELDVSSEDVALFEFSVMTPGILKETVSA